MKLILSVIAAVVFTITAVYVGVSVFGQYMLGTLQIKNESSIPISQLRVILKAGNYNSFDRVIGGVGAGASTSYQLPPTTDAVLVLVYNIAGHSFELSCGFYGNLGEEYEFIVTGPTAAEAACRTAAIPLPPEVR